MAIIKKFRIKSFKENKPLIRMEKISLSFGKRQILDNINFNVNSGEILGMLGPNGVGKIYIIQFNNWFNKTRLWINNNQW